MQLNTEASQKYIADLAQTAPFRFIDRVSYLDDLRVVTELHLRTLPHRFVDPDEIETYAIFEFAAQSSGLILHGRKKAGGRGFITSLSGRREAHSSLEFPLQLESCLVEDSSPLFQFRFRVHDASALVFVGTVGIFIRR